ncbi:lambda-crystallin homolog [Brienomyrus brachyistius]|uniref:lambda-crystallin homolog n=1 Tax=Brienomyrus brachyistius TaxID=42636 RepID=UPI0020B2C217|nr:lambda-crystallin homolog [Brienomyrus brachyistius]
MSTHDRKIISVIGSGLIGCSWTMVFLSGGYRVKIYDKQPGQAAKAVQNVRLQIEELQQNQMLRGNLNSVEQLALLSSHENLSEALEGAFFVQECVFEDLAVKQAVFHELEGHVGKDVILSSSTSCLLPSSIFSEVQSRMRCIVCHPVNPPYFVRLVELVPHPETLPVVMDSTFALMTQIGQAPVRLMKEIDGFALNRIQYAIIAESWRLVKDGVISVQDIDLVMSEGLGMRYAFNGPLETMHLNAPDGLEDYLRRYKEGMQRVLSSFGPVPEFSDKEAEVFIQDMCKHIPSSQLSVRREQRNNLVMGLAKLKKMTE